MKLHWETKAKIMKTCAFLPAGGIYRFIQKTFGRLKADPMARIPAQIEMMRWVLEMGGKVEGKTFFEVSTGHCPVVLIGLFLCGAEKVITVDLNKRLDFGILEKALVWMAENRDEIFEGLGFDVCRKEVQADNGAREIMRSGFVVDERFQDYSVDDLCATVLRIALKENRKVTGI